MSGTGRIDVDVDAVNRFVKFLTTTPDILIDIFQVRVILGANIDFLFCSLILH